MLVSGYFVPLAVTVVVVFELCGKFQKFPGWETGKGGFEAGGVLVEDFVEVVRVRGGGIVVAEEAGDVEVEWRLDRVVETVGWGGGGGVGGGEPGCDEGVGVCDQ